MIGAEILTQAMSESGTSVVFSLSGNQIMPIYDACIAPGIRIVHVRHENAAVFMADAYAQVNSDAGSDAEAGYGVALVTAGPGFANALGGLYSALMAESPVVLISGDSSVAQDGSRAFQELSQIEASKPFVKHAVRVTEVNSIADTWCECVSIATSGRPGPVHLAIPFDVLLAAGNTPRSVSKNGKAGMLSGFQSSDKYRSGELASETGLSDAMSALQRALRPLVVTGPSITASRMPDLLNRLHNATGVPVIAMESPRGLADPSLGNISQVVEQADCVLLLGKLPDFTLGFGSVAKIPADTIVLVDACADSLQQSRNVLSQRQKEIPNEPDNILAINECPVRAADVICKSWEHAVSQPKWLDAVTQQLAAEPQTPDVGDSDADVNGNAGLLPHQIGAQVQAAVDQCEQSILVCDGGEFGQWAQACVRSECRVINGPSGAIGGSLPQAIAAKIAHPNSVVFTMLGDGTAGFHLAELETSVREQAPIIVIIGNDSRWNAEYQIQLRDYGTDRLHSCELGTNVRYDLAAVGLGCAGAMVQTEAELTKALVDAVYRSQRDKQSTCINVVMTGCPAPVFNRV